MYIQLPNFKFNEKPYGNVASLESANKFDEIEIESILSDNTIFKF